MFDYLNDMSIINMPGLRILEGVLLFVGIPLLEYFELLPLPKLLVLILVAGYCGYQLWFDPDFGRSLFGKSESHQISKKILLRVVIIAPALAGLVWALPPLDLFSFPIERPLLWMIVMVLYPLLSALPQEFIYRTFFFHRYQNLTTLKHGDVLCSAAAFSFLHIVYDNWWAVGLSFIAGILFGLTYKQSRSLFWVTVEHIIYGWLLFTLGLGPFFYEAF